MLRISKSTIISAKSARRISQLCVEHGQESKRRKVLKVGLADVGDCSRDIVFSEQLIDLHQSRLRLLNRKIVKAVRSAFGSNEFHQRMPRPLNTRDVGAHPRLSGINHENIFRLFRDHFVARFQVRNTEIFIITSHYATCFLVTTLV